MIRLRSVEAHPLTSFGRRVVVVFQAAAVVVGRGEAPTLFASTISTLYGDEKAANRDIRVWHTARQKMVLERWTNPKPLQSIWDRAAI